MNHPLFQRRKPRKKTFILQLTLWKMFSFDCKTTWVLLYTKWYHSHFIFYHGCSSFLDTAFPFLCLFGDICTMFLPKIHEPQDGTLSCYIDRELFVHNPWQSFSTDRFTQTTNNSWIIISIGCLIAWKKFVLN